MDIFIILNLLFRLLIPADAQIVRQECPDPSYLDGISGGSQQRTYIVATDRCSPSIRGERIYMRSKE